MPNPRRKFQHGIEATEFPQTPLALGKSIPKHNILVGDDPVQVEFMEFMTGVECFKKPKVEDEDLLGKVEPQLLQVPSGSALQISADVRGNTGIWSLVPLHHGSAGGNAIVRYAASVLDLKLDKATRDAISAEMFKTEIEDIRAAVWNAVWIMTGEVKAPTFKRWPFPWENYRTWLPKDVDPTIRLNTLYRDLAVYVLLKHEDMENARNFGMSPKRMQALKNMNLNVDKLESTFSELSRWKSQKSDPHIATLKISNIWAN